MEPANVPDAALEELSASNADDAAEVRALARALNRSSGFTLLFACCNDSTRREELIKELNLARRAETPETRTIFLRQSENVLNLAATLREQLATGPMPSAVFVDGMENVLPQARDAGHSAFVANLNAYRNALPATVPRPLVLWVTDWLLGVVARHAPDFFSVKSGVYFFRGEARVGTDRSERRLDATPQLGWENVPREELRARAEEIRALLNAPRTSDKEDSLLEARLAERLGTIYLTLYQIDDAEAAYSRSLKLLEKFAREKVSKDADGENALAAIYHQLGRIAEERRDFAIAEEWYRKSLKIEERQGNEHGAAITYHQLGIIAQERRDFGAAEEWYRKSLKITEQQGDEYHSAVTYHQLGIIAQERRDFGAAEEWYRKSLKITEQQGDEYHSAVTYHQLGRIAQERRDFGAAEEWYRKSLKTAERLGNEYGAAVTYHQLGRIAQERRDFGAAEEWYRKSLGIEERLSDEHGAAVTYHQLGRIAQERRDFGAAEEWYRKSLGIKERQGDEHGAAGTYHQLGVLAGSQDDIENAGRWILKSIGTFIRVNDDRLARQAADNFQFFYTRATTPVRVKLKAMWESANIGPLPVGSKDESAESV